MCGVIGGLLLSKNRVSIVRKQRFKVVWIARGVFRACASAVFDPKRYYRAVLRDAYGEVEL